MEKAERKGEIASLPPQAAPSAPDPKVSKPASAYTEARLRLQCSGGNLQKTFSVETTLFEVASVVHEELGIEVTSFTQNFPKKVFDAVDFGGSLKELGLIPSASLIVK